MGIPRARHPHPPTRPPPLDTNTTALLQDAAAAATQVGAPETWTPQYLVETKVAPHAKAQEKLPSPKPLHPPLKLDTKEHTPHNEWATHYIIPHTTTRKNDAAKITITCHLPHTTQVYELTAPNVLLTHRRHDERYTIQAEGAAATSLYTWTTRADLPQPSLHHAPSWPTPFHTADRPNKKPKHTGVHNPAQEAQHRHDARRKASTLQDDHTIPRISAPPARVSDATHNRNITGIITDCLNSAASRADAVWISEGRSHTRAVARLNNIQPHKLQRAVGPFAVHITPYGINNPRCEHHDPPCSTPCTSPLRQPLPAPTITGNMYLGTVPGDPGIYILPNRSREHAIPLHGVESLALGPPPPKHQHQHIPGDKRTQAPDGGKKAHLTARSAWSPKAAQALGCSLTPGLRISFGRVSCMARAASVPGLWTLGFLLLCGVCVWVRVAVGCGFSYPRQSWLGSWAGVFGYGLWCCPSFAGWCLWCSWSGLGFGLHMGRAWLRARSACTPPFPVPVCGVGVRAGVWVSAAPRHSLGGCWDVCVLVRPSRVVSCTSWLGVLCGGAFLCAPPACSPPFLAGVCCVGVRAGPGSRLCPALLGWVVGGLFFLWACLALALWCRLLAVAVPGLVVPVPPSHLFRAGLLALFFFQRGVCLRVLVSLFPVGRCSWFGVAGFGWVVPLCPFGGPVLGAFSEGGVAASCGVGGRFGGCGPFSRPLPPPPLFFFWGGGLSIPPSDSPGLAHALARIQCGLPGCC